MVVELKEPGKEPRENMNKKGRMMCPVCEVPLSMADRQGVEIDFCPDCRGGAGWIGANWTRSLNGASTLWHPKPPKGPAMPTTGMANRADMAASTGGMASMAATAVNPGCMSCSTRGGTPGVNPNGR